MCQRTDLQRQLKFRSNNLATKQQITEPGETKRAEIGTRCCSHYIVNSVGKEPS